VAGTALEIRADVPRVLALSLHVVVAGRAAPMSLRMIEVDGGYPGDRCVAALAVFRRQDVIRRFRRRANAAADAVARRTGARCAFEYCVGVAFFTRQVAVSARQLKAGREMVELRTLLRAETRRHERQRQQKCKQGDGCAHRVA